MRLLLTLLFIFLIFDIGKRSLAQEDTVTSSDVEFDNPDEQDFADELSEDEEEATAADSELDEIEAALEQVGSEDESSSEDTSNESEISNEEEVLEEAEVETEVEEETDGVEIEAESEGIEDEIEEEFEESEDDFSVSETESNLSDAGAFSSSDTVDIINVEFNGNEDGGTIIITASDSVEYSTRRTNSGKQVVVEISNARLPDRFKRPYDTKEFSSNIGFFQGYQGEGSSVARFVIQLREDIEPNITQSGNSIRIAAQGSNASYEETSSDNFVEESVQQDTQEQENFDDRALRTDETDGSPDKFYGHLISIELRNSPIVDAIRLIIEESGANILMSNIPNQTVTFKLRNVPWDQALSILMKSNGLGYTRQGEVIIIRPLADMQSAVQAQANFKKQQAEAQKQQAEAERQIEDLGPVENDVIPIYNSKADDVVAAINGLKVLTDKGTIHVLKDNNSLLVKDSVKKIAQIRKLVKDKIDRPALQVLIEGKIIEASESFAKSFGMQIETVDEDADPSISLPFSGGGTASLGLTISNMPAISIGDLTARLNFLETKSVARILASPRVVTLNNKAAKISQTETRVKINETVNNEINSTTQTREYRDLPLSLDVTPIISADGVTMKVAMQRKYASGSDDTEYSRDISTDVFVKHGDTTVIGGVYTSDRDVSESGVPFLRRLPLLGNLFKNSTTSSGKNELMIFLTPTIINRGAAIGMNLSQLEDDEEDVAADEDFSEEFDDI